MYYFITFFLLFVLFFLLFFHFRKRKIIRKLCRMTEPEKYGLLEELVRPLGYHYDPTQDIFSSTTDAWQKNFGYGAVYDTFAPMLNMVIDAQPVYFDYDGKTWLVEFWKGQYGINTGCELGIYHADGIIPPEARKHTLFSAVNETEYPDLSIRLFRSGDLTRTAEGPHWWQTIFAMGIFSNPRDLMMKIRISFPDIGMRNAFAEGLHEAGYDTADINLSLCSTEVAFDFCSPGKRPGILRSSYCRLVQLINRFCCWLYRFVTRPFQRTSNRILYLYYYLPFAFRRMMRLRRHVRRRPQHK